MGVLLVIGSFFMGYFGLMLDGCFQGDVVLFSIAFFLTPSIYAIGRIFDKLIFDKRNDQEDKGQ